MDAESWIRSQQGLGERLDAAKGREVAADLLAGAASLSEMLDAPEMAGAHELREKTEAILLQTEAFAEELRAMAVPAERLARAVPEAIARLDQVPPVDIPQEVIAGVVAGGELGFGPAGTMAGRPGLDFAFGVLTLHRERQAIEIAVDLRKAMGEMDAAFLAMAARLGRKGPTSPIGDGSLEPMELNAFARLLRHHPFYRGLQARLAELARDGALVVGATAGVPDGPGGLDLDLGFPAPRAAGPAELVADYAPLLAGGLTGDLAEAYLAGHDVTCTVVAQLDDGDVGVRFVATRDRPADGADQVGLEDLRTLGVAWAERVSSR